MAGSNASTIFVREKYDTETGADSLKKFEVFAVDFAGRDDMADCVTQSLEVINSRGLLMIYGVFVDGQHFVKEGDSEYAEETIASTDGRGLYLNPTRAFWEDPIGFIKASSSTGLFSSDNDFHVVYHEVGHWIHIAADSKKHNENKRIRFGASEQETAAEVSIRTMESPNEFVAEAFACAQSGNVLDGKIKAFTMTRLLLCIFCEHYNTEHRVTCKAFPNGIPHEILFGKVKHVFPIVGDNGFVFAPKDETADRLTHKLVDAVKTEKEADLLAQPLATAA